MHPTALIISARTRARELGSQDPRAKRLSRLAEQLESIDPQVPVPHSGHSSGPMWT